MSALDSYCCCNKLPQSSVEKQQRFFFIVLEVKSLPWSSQQGCNPSGGFRGQSGSLSFPSSREDAFLGSWALPPSSKLSRVCTQSSVCDPMDCSPPGSSVHETLQQEYWSGLPCPLPGDLPNPGIEPAFLTSPALAGGFFATSSNWKPPKVYSFCLLWPPSSLL